jgi:hypothetical protein
MPGASFIFVRAARPAYKVRAVSGVRPATYAFRNNPSQIQPMSAGVEGMGSLLVEFWFFVATASVAVTLWFWVRLLRQVLRARKVLI